jgi:Toprim domain
MKSDHVRAFYAAIGIELPAWSTREAPVRCFAQPDAHSHADRLPSCSVNLVSGAWNCHGCGAHGGAYDAATAIGHTPRSAMELLIEYGLAEPRDAFHGPSCQTPTRQREGHPATATPPPLAADEGDIQQWACRLAAESRLIRLLALKRAWSYRAIRELDVGFDGARITIPIRNAEGRIRGVLRYAPFGHCDPKMLAIPGTRLGLVPHPAHDTSEPIVLVEGPQDMIAARSCGLHAIAVPGTNAWQSSWAGLFAGRRVTVVMDCDRPGRGAADQIATGLEPVAKTIEVVDLWPDRHDGYDLTDRILECRRAKPYTSRRARTVAALLRPAASLHQQTGQDR